ncbi:hypothetical protein T492DRAFT_928304 [Pavlovales sp. CCMP2436]|nr:hypothetical protein T492DRAFT_928304 [Pavlovales sp. CCMP2436]
MGYRHKKGGNAEGPEKAREPKKDYRNPKADWRKADKAEAAEKLEKPGKAEKEPKETTPEKAGKKAKAPKEAPAATGTRDHVADTLEAAALTGRALKARLCFNWQRKGRCPKGGACIKLHAGEPEENRAATVQKAVEKKVAETDASGKRKRGKAPPGPDEEPAPRKSQRPGDWVCSGCGNTNWGRRDRCNGRTCGTPRPGEQEAGAPPVWMGQSQKQRVML